VKSFQKSLILIVGLILFSLFYAQPVKASCANVPISGDYTVTSSCTFANTVDGVDSGPGSVNSASIIVPPGQTLTVNQNTTISYGQIQLQNGASFGSRTDLTTGASYGDYSAAADFNGDGKPDLAVSNNGTSIYIYLGTGTGFPASPSYTLNVGSGVLADHLVAADFSGDGKPDLAVTLYNQASSPQVEIFTNSGGTLPTNPSYGIAAGFGTLHMVAADFNGDGKPDLAVINYNDGNGLYIFINNNGTLPSTPTQALSQNGAIDIATADFNGDGKPDLAVFNVNSVSGTQGIDIYLNTSGSISSISYILTASLTGGELIAGDFNGDGKPDLAVGANYTVSLLIFINNNGTLPTNANYNINPNFGISDMAVSDFNGDRVDDLVVGGGGVLKIYYGDQIKSSSSNPGTTLTLSASSYSISAGDFNNDGKKDVAITDGTPVVSYFLNTGTITGLINFNTQHTTILKKGPLWVPNQDGDGAPDTGNPTQVAQATQPGGYSRRDVLTTLTADCAPADNTKWQNFTMYTDADGDNYGAGSSSQVCIGLSAPPGYSFNNTDCDDTSSHVYQNLSCAGTPTTKSYSAAQQTYTVPAGVTSLQIEAYGGIGGSGYSGAIGGNGGYVKGKYTVTPNETLYIYTGGAASTTTAGYNGGGAYGDGYSSYDGGAGGGATDVRQGGTALANRIIVAGGGGGGGAKYSTYGAGGPGGAGGAATGATGSNGSYTTYSTYFGYGGGGGTSSAGGAGGAKGYTTGGAGAVGTSGTGGTGGTYTTSSTYNGGGGGGGGYWGGGGGGTSRYEGAGGGGGGSNYVGAGTNTVSTAGVNNTNGYVVLTPYVTTCSGAACMGSCAGWVNAGYCWYNGATQASCNTTCSTHGGVAGGTCDWTGDPINCSTCLHFYSTATCPQSLPYAPYHTNSNVCYYHSGGNSNCDYTAIGMNPQCACNN